MHSLTEFPLVFFLVLKSPGYFSLLNSNVPEVGLMLFVCLFVLGFPTLNGLMSCIGICGSPSDHEPPATGA